MGVPLGKMATIAFPDTIGPFTMQTAQLAQAFNQFYSRNGFPRPDPSRNDNSMAGLDHHSIPEAMFLQLSPLHRITLDAETKVAANIPREATFFAWAYPMVEEPGKHAPSVGGAAESAFLKLGGFVYFDNEQNAVGTNAICPAPLGTLALMFGRPQILSERVAEELTLKGRFQEVTLEPLVRGGATHFAWIRPTEFSDVIANPDGCFAYLFASGPPRYFPVVQKPVFTKELLEEELDRSEAWVVVRDERLGPMLEEIAIFDKSKSFEENMEMVDHGSRRVEAPTEGVWVSREGAAGAPEISYQEWTCTDDGGSVAKPWILRVPALAAAEGLPVEPFI